MRLDPDPRHESWGYPPLPEWVESFRDDQVTAAQRIESLFLGGTRFVFLDAPTGAGKTLIAEMVRRRLNQKALYLCTTKTLQSQFVHDFPHGKLIKGRSNYPTADLPRAFAFPPPRRITAADCTKERLPYPGCDSCTFIDYPDEWWDEDQTTDPLHCFYCHPWQSCPYELAKSDALSSNLAVANTSYFMTEANTAARFGATDKRGPTFPFVIIDEADSLEDEVMRYVEFTLPPPLIKRLRIPEPALKTVPEVWPEWAAVKALPVLKREQDRLWAEVRSSNTPEPTTLREYKRVSGLYQRLKAIGPHLAENWVYTGYDSGRIQFRPIKVDEVAPDVLWKHGTQFLLMSATIISPGQMADDLGMPRGSWGAVNTPSSFPIESRPIHVQPRANMTKNTKELEWPKMAQAVKEVCANHPHDRILVHTMSYALTAFLADHLDPTRTISYESAEGRDQVLQEFRATRNAILLAPSFERGVDLPDEDCRVIIIAKVMYPYLGDKQVSARFHAPGGKGWYSMQTVRSLVQSTGRAMRHEQDYCTTYILDSQFVSNVWYRSRGIIPRWWADALVWEPPKR